MKLFQFYIYAVCIIYTMISMSCHKKDYLSEDPIADSNLLHNLENLQGLLDNEIILNTTPNIGDLSSDNYFIRPSVENLLSQQERNLYLWAQDVFMNEGSIPDWNIPYEQVFYCNTVLEALNKIQRVSSNQTWWNGIKGTALFLRGNAFYNLAQLFMLPYDSQTAATDLGLPLRLTDDISEMLVRSTVQETYEQIISDLTAATDLLPQEVDTAHLNRPSKPAALALLSKVFLSMRMYEVAGTYADSCLMMHNKLLNYNTLAVNTLRPFLINNPEILFYSTISPYITFGSLTQSRAIIDSLLYRSYDSSDLRRSLFYNIVKGEPVIKSSYSATSYLFSGVALDEIYLIKSECLARAGHLTAALENVNILLRNRYKPGTFTPLKATTTQEALQIILTERRKELPFRNIRWTDLRRLNKEGRNIRLARIIFGQQYELEPNSPRYVLPIPFDVITFTNMQQNPR
jgi:starch-binding outer membrane protein, SusD/RagB family